MDLILKTSKCTLPKDIMFIALMVWLVLGLTVPAQAKLIDRGSFNDGLGGMMNLIYDDDLMVTCLGY